MFSSLSRGGPAGRVKRWLGPGRVERPRLSRREVGSFLPLLRAGHETSNSCTKAAPGHDGLVPKMTMGPRRVLRLDHMQGTVDVWPCS